MQLNWRKFGLIKKHFSLLPFINWLINVIPRILIFATINTTLFPFVRWTPLNAAISSQQYHNVHLMILFTHCNNLTPFEGECLWMQQYHNVHLMILFTHCNNLTPFEGERLWMQQYHRNLQSPLGGGEVSDIHEGSVGETHTDCPVQFGDYIWLRERQEAGCAGRIQTPSQVVMLMISSPFVIYCVKGSPWAYSFVIWTTKIIKILIS